MVVGDTGVGKSCFLHAGVTGKFPDPELPLEKLDNRTLQPRVDGYFTEVIPWDTNGHDDFAQLRAISYSNTDVFLVCFSVDSKESFSRVDSFWLPELIKHCPETPVFLVATKIDLRESTLDVSSGMVTTAEGRDMAERLKLAGFCECSSVRLKGVDTAITEAIRAVIKQRSSAETQPPPPPSHVCVLL